MLASDGVRVVVVKAGVLMRDYGPREQRKFRQCDQMPLHKYL